MLKASLLDSLSEGDVIDGKVARLTNFGAFIDIGGVDGLVHVSDYLMNMFNHQKKWYQLVTK